MSAEWIGRSRISADLREPASQSLVPFALAALLLVAAALALPAALGPVRLNDSFWIDIVWLEQFAGDLGSGTIYPRWLPLSHDGLGSPVFYYYPPLAFYLGSTFTFLGLSTYLALIATFATATLLSGIGVYLWLKDQSRAALACALLFMITPYQLFNFYQRGAVAEFLASALVPFVLVGTRRIAMNRRGGIFLTAISYAALVMSHLPLAFLASLFLIAPHALISGWKSPAALVRMATAFALGLGLSAVYVVPAIALEPYRSSADLWTLRYLQPATWTVWSAEAWSDQTYRAIVIVSAALVIPSAGLVAREKSLWAIWTVICLLIAIGAVPFIWSLPGLRWVQFPFRLLPIAELAFVTAAARGAKGRVPWLMIWAAFLLVGAFIVAAKPESANLGDRMMRGAHPDVPENLPPGVRPYSWPSKWALEVAKEHRQPQFDGKVTVEPVFYFPSWEVRCGGRAVRTFPDPTTTLLAHEGEGCRRELVATGPERIGAYASLAALLTLISFAFLPSSLARHRSRPREILPRNT